MLPVYLKIADVPVLVVGGGQVAAHKIDWLLAEGARVLVVSITFVPKLVALAENHPSLTLQQRPYHSTDCHGVRLVIAATNDEATNGRVAADASDAGLWVNVVDRPALCTFYVPASGSTGPIQLAIGTGGVSPSLAAELRDHLMRQIPADIGDFASALQRLREHCVQQFPDFDVRARAMRRAARSFLDPARPSDKDALVEWLLRRALDSTHMT